MFTGIIQNQARVTCSVLAGGQIHFSFRFLKAEKRKIELGESIAVNGVCLTVVKIIKSGFEADAVRETLQAALVVIQQDAGPVAHRAILHGSGLERMVDGGG